MNFLYTQYHSILHGKKRPSHDTYLYRRWNNPTAHSTTKKTRTTNQLASIDCLQHNARNRLCAQKRIIVRAAVLVECSTSAS